MTETTTPRAPGYRARLSDRMTEVIISHTSEAMKAAIDKHGPEDETVMRLSGMVATIIRELTYSRDMTREYLWLLDQQLTLDGQVMGGRLDVQSAMNRAAERSA